MLGLQVRATIPGIPNCGLYLLGGQVYLLQRALLGCISDLRVGLGMGCREYIQYKQKLYLYLILYIQLQSRGQLLIAK